MFRRGFVFGRCCLTGFLRAPLPSSVRCYVPADPSFDHPGPAGRGATWQTTGKGNVFLMGCPGSGKTSLGKLVGAKLGMTTLDVDDDLLEKQWKMSVAEKLQSVGGEEFVEMEGAVLAQLDVENSVISLSGSNPLHQRSMRHIQELGIVVYVDAAHGDILKRLHEMKVDRIVGQGKGKSMSDILKYREQFYDNYHDIRTICGEGESLGSIADKIVESLSSYNRSTNFVSTRGVDECDFSEAILRGLANDEGLFVPESNLPRFRYDELKRLVPLDYHERALRIIERLVHPRYVHRSQLKEFVKMGFSEEKFGPSPCRVMAAPDNPRGLFFSELFHGPTGSFKDLALQFVPHIFSHLKSLNSTNRSRFLMLVATSGDTGSSVAKGFQSFTGDGSVKVLILFPEDGVSDIQKLQMLAAAGEDVSVVGVKGDFDFCQNAIKTIFADQNIVSQLHREFNVKLSAANSINWARIMSQIVYHISGYLDLVDQKVVYMGQEVDVAVPTGNFGNILSAFYAKNMGLPIRKLICASNSNNILTEFINTGTFNLAGRSLQRTSSPAIDILRPSNLERYIYAASNRNSAEVNLLYRQLKETGRFKVSSLVKASLESDFLADWCMESSCLGWIKDYHAKTGYLLDPHTAVALAVSKKFEAARGSVPLLICATAHFAKFPFTVLQALERTPVTGSPLELLRRLEDLDPRPEMHKMLKNIVSASPVSHSVLPADVSAIVSHIKSLF